MPPMGTGRIGAAAAVVSNGEEELIYAARPRQSHRGR